MMKSRKNTGSFSGKGYYIALILCAAAIGISGYLYYRNANEEPVLQNPTLDTSVGNQNQDDLPVISTDPTQSGTQATKPSDTGKVPDKGEKWKTDRPVDGQILHGYAMDCLSYNPTTRDWRVHDGIDIAAAAGTEVLAAAAGTVYTTYEDDTMGTTVVIRHQDGYVTVYSSLDPKLAVTAGDSVELGQVLGYVANTALLENAVGDHLHFSVTCNDEPMDPELFFALE